MPMDATHFVLSCGSSSTSGIGSSSNASIGQSLGTAADHYPQQPQQHPLAAAVKEPSGCVLLALPYLRPLRLVDGPHGDLIVEGYPPSANAIATPDGAMYAQQDEDDEVELEPPPPIDPMTLAGTVESAERFKLVLLGAAKKGKKGGATLETKASAQSHATMQLYARDGKVCVALSEPTRLHATSASGSHSSKSSSHSSKKKEELSTECDTVRLHVMLLPHAEPPAPQPSEEAAASDAAASDAKFASEVAEALASSTNTSSDSEATDPSAAPLSAWVRPPPRTSIRLLQWNVLDGCQGAPQRLGGIGKWLIQRGADIVAFNEMNGWSDKTFARLSRSLGFRYSAFLETGTGYHLGLISRIPMVVDVLAGTANGFHHGALLVQVGGIRICVTHLSPRDASHRLSEANEILKLERNREPHRGFVLVGDLNTLSPLDEAEHNATGLPATLGRDVGLARKFLLKPAVVAAAAANAVARTAAAADAADDDDAAPAASTSFFGRIFGGAATAAPTATVAAAATPPMISTASIDYAPMRALLDGGLADAGHMTMSPVDSETGLIDGAPVQNHSVPTLINEDVMHATTMRLDYAMINRPIREECVVQSWITRDAETERLSDHYPVLTDIDCDGW